MANKMAQRINSYSVKCILKTVQILPALYSLAVEESVIKIFQSLKRTCLLNFL